MTRKEAIEFLKNMIDRESVGFVCQKNDGDVAIWEYHVTALNMAIKALEQGPCEDAVSRTEAIRIASGYCHPANVAKELEKLPSVTPERKWIPCSERFPEENTPVLLGVKFKDDFKYFVTARMDYNYWTGLGRDIRGKLAWMPLPEPYTERREE